MDVLRWLAPDEYLPSVRHVDLRRLQARGIRGLIVDLDNTLAPWRGGPPSPELVAWVAEARRLGLGVCIVSNNWGERVQAVGRVLGVPVVRGAVKPRRSAFRRALALLGTTPQETAVIGDQLFTDVLGGKRLGMYTVLVVPLSRREFVGTRLVRRLERWVLRRLQRAGWLSEPVADPPPPPEGVSP